MKKILFILGLASLLVTGCGDFFDTAPSNKIPTTMAFRSPHYPHRLLYGKPS